MRSGGVRTPPAGARELEEKMFRSRKVNRLAELLDDPVVALVMKSDGVDRRSLELLFEQAHTGRREPARADGAYLQPVIC